MHTDPDLRPFFTIELFGGLRVREGEREVTHIKRQKPAALLAFLACHSGYRHSREVLCELLWPESDPESARNRLNVTFSRLRDELTELFPDADSIFVSDRSQIGINRECVQTDVGEFEACLKRAAAAGDDEARARSLENAIEYYRGPLLPGLYDAWISMEQEQIRERLNRALTDLIGILKANSRTDEAIEYARRVVAAEPLLENAHDTLIRLLIQAGRPADALQQYRSLENILRQELDIAPSVETEALLDAIRKASAPPNGNGANGNGTAIHTDLTPGLAESPTVEQEARQQSVLISLRPKSRLGIFAKVAATSVILAGIGIAGMRPLVHRTAKAPALKPSEGGKLLWQWRYSREEDDSPEGGSEPTAITSDAAGNLYVCGFVRTKKQDVDFLTFKFAPDGNLLWKRRWNNTKVNDCDRARSIAVDGAGNVYVTGDSYGGDRERGGTQWDMVTVKYDANGKELWSRRFNNSPHNDDMPIGMALDKKGNVYTLASIMLPDKSGTFALIRYNSSGQIIWTYQFQLPKEYGRLVYLSPHSLCVKESAILVTCEAMIQDKQGQTHLYVLTESHWTDWGTNWWRRFTGTDTTGDIGWLVTGDGNGNTYVAATDHVAGDGSGRDSLIILKYDPRGTELWSTRCYPMDSHTRSVGKPVGLVVDGAGNVFARCSRPGQFADGKPWVAGGANGGWLDVFALSPDGRVLWSDAEEMVYGGTGLSVGQDSGVTLSAHDWRGFGANSLRTWRYAANGRRLWTREYQTGTSVYQTAVHQDALGNTITAGHDSQGILLLKYSP